MNLSAGPVAILDVDDTLADLCSAVCKTLEKKGRPFPREKWWTHDWCAMFDMPLPELRKMLKEEVDYANLELLSPDWIYFVNQLKQEGITPVYVTARGNVFGDDAKSITADWLTKVGIPTSPYDVIPTHFGRPKAHIVQDLGLDVVLTVDDYFLEVVEHKNTFPNAMNILVESYININNNAHIKSYRKWCPRQEVRRLIDVFLDWRTVSSE